MNQYGQCNHTKYEGCPPCIHDGYKDFAGEMSNIDRLGEYVVLPTFHDKCCPVGVSGEFVFNNCECVLIRQVRSDEGMSNDSEYLRGYLNGYSDAEKHYTNACTLCGTGGISSTWLCISCKEQNPDWNGEQ